MTVIKPIKSGANGTGQEKPLIYALQQELGNSPLFIDGRISL